MDDVVMSLDRQILLTEFDRVRSDTEALCAPLHADDYQVQSIVQTSPPKWHIAHVSWFFETFVLPHFSSTYSPFDPRFDFIFNSYYYTHGQMYPRASRGMLSRPDIEEVYRYRAYVNDAMRELIATIDEDQWESLLFRVTLGVNHEQQHQELLLMDIKHNFSVNPLKPAYRGDLQVTQGLKKHGDKTRPIRWVERAGGIQQIGHAGEGFAFDNETPRHDVLINDHRLADRFITNGEYMEFIQSGGYENPALWLSDGWALIQREGWRCPLYWQQDESADWMQFTLGGLLKLNFHEPVCHLGFYEADAYARWVGKRLPLESEMEMMLAEQVVTDDDNEQLHPAPAGENGQWFGELWAWTASPYTAYPGFKTLAGSMGEYNGKFMSNQMVLKGGSCVTPHGHSRATYRNFFYPDERWAFTGLRLAEDV